MNEQRVSAQSWTRLEALGHQQDQRAQRNLDKLSAQAEQLDQQVVDSLTELVKGATLSVEQKILSALRDSDSKVDALLNGAEITAQALRAAQRSVAEHRAVPVHIMDLMRPHLASLTAHQQELWKTVEHGRYSEDVTAALGSLANSLSSVDSLWTRVLKDGNLPSFLIERKLANGDTVGFIESMSFWIDLQSLLNKLDEAMQTEMDKQKRKVLRAKVFNVALKDSTQFLSPSLLEDLIEERYDKTDPWIGNNIFDTFTGLEEEIRNHEHKLNPTQKRLIALMVMVMLGVAIAAAGGEQLQSKVRSVIFPVQQTSTQTVQAEPTPEATPTTTSESQNASGATGENRQGPITSPPQRERSSSPENSGDFPQGIIWNIEGEIPSGYLRTDTATDFYSNPIWNMDSLDGTVRHLPKTSPNAVTYFVSAFQLSASGSYPIPLPYSGLDIVSVDAGEGEYSVQMSTNGVATLIVASISAPHELRIGLGHAENEVTDPISMFDLDIVGLLGEVASLPQEVQLMLQEVNELPIAQRAARVTAFVKNYFTYSLDPQYSNYQRAEPGRGEFVRRILAMPFGDCDVINTLNVSFMRAAGVPSRMAYGYMNDGSLVSTGGNTVDAGEAHGWAEYFDGTKWVAADATPDRVDEYTRQRLVDRNGGGGIESIDLSNIGELLKLQALVVLDWLKTYGLSSAGLTLLLTYVGSWIALYRSRSNQHNRIRKVVDLMKRGRGTNANRELEKSVVEDLTWQKLDIQGLSDRFSNFGAFMFDYFTLVPAIAVNRLRHNRISRTEEYLNYANLPQIAKSEIYEILEQGLGINNKDAGRHIIAVNMEYRLNISLSPFFSAMVSDSSKKLGVPFSFNPENFQKSNDTNQMIAIAKRAASLSDFLNTSMDLYYQSYVRAYKKANRQWIGQPTKDKLPVMVSYEEFSSTFATEFVYLVDFYKYVSAYEATLKKLNEKPSEEKPPEALVS